MRLIFVHAWEFWTLIFFIYCEVSEKYFRIFNFFLVLTSFEMGKNITCWRPGNDFRIHWSKLLYTYLYYISYSNYYLYSKFRNRLPPIIFILHTVEAISVFFSLWSVFMLGWSATFVLSRRIGTESYYLLFFFIATTVPSFGTSGVGRNIDGYTLYRKSGILLGGMPGRGLRESFCWFSDNCYF